MKNDKQRLFEVMGRLDKTFKPKLNEGFEEIEATDDIEISAGEEAPIEEPVEEKSPEEKLAELTAKVDELYALLHGEGEEAPAEEIPAEVAPEEVPELENLEEWNFDKKKGEDKKEEKEEDKEEEKKEEKDLDESSEKVPVEAVAKVGEAK